MLKPEGDIAHAKRLRPKIGRTYHKAVSLTIPLYEFLFESFVKCCWETSFRDFITSRIL